MHDTVHPSDVLLAHWYLYSYACHLGSFNKYNVGGGGGYLCLAEDPPENKAVKPPGWLWGCLIQPSFSFFGAQHTEIRGWVSTTSTLAATGPPFPSQTPLQLGVWEALPLATRLI